MVEKNYRCSGCMACKEICPAGCISIQTNKTGDFERKIDLTKCIQCGKCEQICPVDKVCELHMPEKAYVAWNRSQTVNRRSSSGGAAAAIYEYCIRNNIKCVGVRYDRELRARYDFIKNIEEIRNYTGSKYVYSHMDGIYKQIIEYLKNGEEVVFIGLPCHAAALQNVVKGKDTRLTCIDLVCHGVTAEQFLREHIRNMKKVKWKEIFNVEFREEKNPYGITLRGRKGKLLRRQSREQDEYMLGYCQGFTYCQECYNCRYAGKERASDLTLKDFCGMQTGILSKQKYGLSNVLVNTTKGKEFIQFIEPYLHMIDYPVESVIKQDAMLQRPSEGKKKELFRKLYPLLGFDLTVRVLCFGTIMKNRVKKMFYR